MADFDEEERAERAREFSKNINDQTPRSSRKRYSLASPYVHAQGQLKSGGEDGLSASVGSVHNQFLSGVSPSVQGVPLDNFGTNLIYRDVNELTSLNKVHNFCLKVFPQPLRNALLPPLNLAQWKKFWFVHIPILHWLWSYRPKQLVGDIIAGLTIGVTHVPQGIGFALLANLPPVYGLYSSFFPVILYSFLGSSRHISVGTFPVVALMTGDAITRLTLALPQCPPPTFNDSVVVDPQACFVDDCTPIRVDVAVTLSLLVGMLMILMSLLKLGFITLFLSDPLVSGYTAAAAFTIFVTQIKFIFGLDPTEAAVHSGPGVTVRRVIRFAELIFTGHINPAALITALVCIGILLGIDFLNRFLHKKIRKVPVHIPAQLIVVIIAAGISAAADLHGRFNLPIIEDLGGIAPRQCFTVTHPDFKYADSLITDAIVIAIISFVINISQAKLLAKKNGYTVHPDQEFFAYGIMNFGGSFFGSFPTAGALSRTVLQDATGGHTQLVGFLSSGIVLIVILFLGFLFRPLPNAALAAIVVVALKGLYLQVRDIYKYFKLSYHDMLVWLVVFFSTLVVGLDIGLGVGVAFSLLVVVYKTILPFSPRLGEARAWQYLPNQLDENFDEEELKVFKVDGVYIYQFNSPLYFANVSVFRSKLLLETGINPEELGCMTSPGCIQIGCTRMCSCCSPNQKKKKKVRTSHLSSSSSSKALVEGESEGGSESSQYVEYGRMTTFSDEEENVDEGDDEVFAENYTSIIIDCAPIGFTDTMGVSMLEQVIREYDSIDIQVLLAAPTTPLCDALNRNRFFTRFSSERLFPTVATAVAYCKDGNRVPVLEQPMKPDKSLATNLERQLLYSTRPSLFDEKPEIELERRGTRVGTISISPKTTETETPL